MNEQKKLWQKHTAKVFTLHNCIVRVIGIKTPIEPKEKNGEASYDFL